MSRNRIRSFDLCIKEFDPEKEIMSYHDSPPGPREHKDGPQPTGPLSEPEVTKHTLNIAGEVKIFVNKIPIDTLVDFSETGTHQVYLCCWTDGNNGKSCHVEFPSGSVSQAGKYKLDMDFWDNDTTKLKVQVSMRMRDEETNNRRTVPLCCSYARVDTMLQGTVDEFKMPNAFTEGMYATVSMRVSNASSFRNHPANAGNVGLPLIRMRPSALDRLPELNDKMASVSSGMSNYLQKNNIQFPPGGAQLIGGLSSLEFSGRVNLKTGETECPNLLTHYAVMNCQEESVHRILPVGVLVYHAYLRIVHSGMSAQEVLGMPDEEFGQFFPQCFQVTCDAALVPYEKDFIPGLALSFTEGFTLAAVGSEDMGCPLSMFQLDGRTIREIGKIAVTKSMTMQQLMSLFKQPPLPAGSVKSLNPEISFVQHVPSKEGVLPDQYLGLLYDDCESSARLGRMLKHLSQHLYRKLNQRESFSHFQRVGEDAQGKRGEDLRKLCDGWRVFKNFSSRSWELMSRILDRGNAMLEAGHLKVMTGVGLATNASAEDEVSGSAQYCGHCFNVGMLQTPNMPQPLPFLLEGTASVYQIPVHSDSPKVGVHIYNNESCTGEGLFKQLTMVEFLSALSGELLAMSQVINKPNGGMSRKGGWPLDVEISGWLAKTMVIPSLDSDPAYAHLNFYNRVMFLGLQCTDQGQGCMPIEEKSEAQFAGVHPFTLSNQNVRGLDAAMSPEETKMVGEIMEETTPPLAPKGVIQRLAQNWIPCRPLEQVNSSVVRKANVRTHRVVSMESPCAPEYLSIIHEAKRRFAEETNRINEAREDYDGIRLTALLEGLSSILCADVPDEEIKAVTVLHSARCAMGAIGWPGYKIAEDCKTACLKKNLFDGVHPWSREGTKHDSIQSSRIARGTRRREAGNRQAQAQARVCHPKSVVSQVGGGDR